MQVPEPERCRPTRSGSFSGCCPWSSNHAAHSRFRCGGASSKPMWQTKTTPEPRGAKSQRLLCSLLMTGELRLLPVRVAWETLACGAGREDTNSFVTPEPLVKLLMTLLLVTTGRVRGVENDETETKATVT